MNQRVDMDHVRKLRIGPCSTALSKFPKKRIQLDMQTDLI